MLILGAIILTTLQLIQFSRVRAYLPAGLIVAGVPVGGLDRQQAAQRLIEVYSIPVELYYGDQVVHLQPSVIDYNLDVENMLAVAGLERTQTQFWQEFWDYLWGRTEFPSQIPLNATFSEERLRAVLADIAERYDQAPEAALPVPGSVNFQAGSPGIALDQDGSIRLIESALNSLDSRTVSLPLDRIDPSRPSFENLDVSSSQVAPISIERNR
jgi:hypothetical protein